MNNGHPTHDPAEDLRAQMLEQSSIEIQSIASGIASLAPQELEKKKVLEPVFKDVFLPMFLGQKNERYPNIAGANWITLAGSAYMEVDVIDHNGKVLFTVPPYMDNRLVEPITGKTETDMKYVANQAQLYENALPVMAERFLSEELTKRVDIMKSHVDTSEVEQAWLKILAFYNIPTSAPAQSSISETPTSSSTDYDEVAP